MPYNKFFYLEKKKRKKERIEKVASGTAYTMYVKETKRKNVLDLKIELTVLRLCTFKSSQTKRERSPKWIKT